MFRSTRRRRLMEVDGIGKRDRSLILFRTNFRSNSRRPALERAHWPARIAQLASDRAICNGARCMRLEFPNNELRVARSADGLRNSMDFVPLLGPGQMERVEPLCQLPGAVNERATQRHKKRQQLAAIARRRRSPSGAGPLSIRRHQFGALPALRRPPPAPEFTVGQAAACHRRSSRCN